MTDTQKNAGFILHTGKTAGFLGPVSFLICKMIRLANGSTSANIPGCLINALVLGAGCKLQSLPNSLPNRQTTKQIHNLTFKHCHLLKALKSQALIQTHGL